MGCCDIASLSLLFFAWPSVVHLSHYSRHWAGIETATPRHRRPRATLCLQAELCSQWGSVCWTERQGLGSQDGGLQMKEKEAGRGRIKMVTGKERTKERSKERSGGGRPGENQTCCQQEREVRRQAAVLLPALSHQLSRPARSPSSPYFRLA